MLLSTLVLALPFFAQTKMPAAAAIKPRFGDSRQLILVTTDDWDSMKGTATLFERAGRNASWRSVAEPFGVVLGAKGLAWADDHFEPINAAPVLSPVVKKYCAALELRDDAALAKLFSKRALAEFARTMQAKGFSSLSRLLQYEQTRDCDARNEYIVGTDAIAEMFSSTYPNGIRAGFVRERGAWKFTNDFAIATELSARSRVRKKEGDGRSPAGLFPLTFVFGNADAKVGPTFPFRKIEEFTECVDDPTSSFYNRVVDRMKVGNFDWKSSEKMSEIVPEYDLGVFVGYNSYPVTRGAGSCIFLHIWKDADSPTAGCTAMARTDLERVVGWLSKSKNPYLVQVPRNIYHSRQKLWKLPKLK